MGHIYWGLIDRMSVSHKFPESRNVAVWGTCVTPEWTLIVFVGRKEGESEGVGGMEGGEVPGSLHAIPPHANDSGLWNQQSWDQEGSTQHLTPLHPLQLQLLPSQLLIS